jgi:hypothetical protein
VPLGEEGEQAVRQVVEVVRHGVRG